MKKVVNLHRVSRLVFPVLFSVSLLTLFSSVLFAQPAYWQQVKQNSNSQETRQSASRQTLTLNTASLQQLFVKKAETINITLPLPRGEFADFILMPTSVVAPELAAKYPNLKTFTGYQVGNKQNSGRFDYTPNGFHGMFRFQGELVFIEPKEKVTTTVSEYQYVSYYRQDNLIKNAVNAIRLQSPKIKPSFIAPLSKTVLSNRLAKSVASETSITTYRLAISAVAEYTQFHGGNVEQTLAELVTLVNRLNDAFQRDLSVKLELVANNDLLIFTDPDSDPFDNTSDDGDINTSVIDGIIGSANYDIGHVVSTGGGGLAILGGVCHSSYKGDGVTGTPNPINDSFYIDYVAHEVGHQFGANHTFNGTESACSGNRDANAAYEPGSASTIMGYAGICGSQNLQNFSDVYFHSKSIDEMQSYITTGGGDCGNASNVINNTPSVDAGNDYSVPALTPFVLTGSATDADNDNLMYSWEQYDLGTASTSVAEQVDDGTRPLFRVRNPIAIASRTFPQLSDILSNSSSIGESYASTNRDLNFQLLVRDEQGGISVDAMKITVIDTGEAFKVTEPLVDAVWNDNLQAVSWNVANTDVSPILCANVDILLSTDGGNSFAILLADNVVNNGRFEVTLATVNSTNTRIKVACSDNVFFAINEGDFTTQTIDINVIEITGQQAISVDQGSRVTLTTDMFTYVDKPAESLIVLTGNNYTVSGTTITPDATFSGTLTVSIQAILANNTSAEFSASVTVVKTPVVVNEVSNSSSSSGGSIFYLLFLLLLSPVIRAHKL